MKTVKNNKFVILVLLISFFIVQGCTTKPIYRKTFYVDAEVLSVNKNILRGKMLGAFLVNSSGNIANDVIVLGLKIPYGEYFELVDVEVQHAEAAYYSDCVVIPLAIEITRNPIGYQHTYKIFLNGRKIMRWSLSKKQCIFYKEAFESINEE